MPAAAPAAVHAYEQLWECENKKAECSYKKPLGYYKNTLYGRSGIIGPEKNHIYQRVIDSQASKYF